MRTCTICGFAVELDDEVVRIGSEHCICLLCFARQTGTERRMPEVLRREVVAAANGSLGYR
jgi:hypothetical protein